MESVGRACRRLGGGGDRDRRRRSWRPPQSQAPRAGQKSQLQWAPRRGEKPGPRADCVFTPCLTPVPQARWFSFSFPNAPGPALTWNVSPVLLPLRTILCVLPCTAPRCHLLTAGCTGDTASSRYRWPTEPRTPLMFLSTVYINHIQTFLLYTWWCAYVKYI